MTEPSDEEVRRRALRETAPVRPGEELDWESLVEYLRSHIDGLEGDWKVAQFPHGGANLTYLVAFGDRRLVVRRPPFGKIAPGAHDMRREFKTLSRLWEAFDRAPRAYAFSDDHSIIGSDFLVVEYRSGEIVRGLMPTALAVHPDVGRRIGFAVVDALADLHLVDPGAVGLTDLGRPEGFVARQIRNWMKRWELTSANAPEPLVDEVGAMLATRVPESPAVSILHNDYKLDNCQFDPADPDRVRSVFDWDMATLGDPMVDLGTLMNYWPDPSDTPDDMPIIHEGMASFGLPARAEAVERYVARCGANVDDLPWYEAFACWKTAVVLQQLYSRYQSGESQDARLVRRGNEVPAQARRARRILAELG